MLLLLWVFDVRWSGVHASSSIWGMRTLIVSVLSMVDARGLYGALRARGAFASAAAAVVVVGGAAADAAICLLSEWDDFFGRRARIGEMV